MLNAKPKVLIVDDVPNNLVALRKLLRKVDCDVIEAGSGNEALAQCLESDFALILLDIDMPDMDGYEVVQYLKGDISTRHIPVIFVTAAFEDEEHQRLGYEVGAVDYIQKPIDHFVLLSKVSIFLELYSSRQQLNQELQRSEAMRLAASVSEARFRQALTHAPIPIMLHVEGGEVMLLSQAWTDLSGYEHKDIRTIDDWIGKAYGTESRDSAGDYFKRLYSSTGWNADFEYEVRARNGDILVWDFHSGALAPLPDGRRLVISMAVDVTERHEREEVQRLAVTVFNTVGNAVMVTDRDNRIVSINPAFNEITGYDTSEVIGCNPKMLASGKQSPEFFMKLWETLALTGAWQGEIWNRRKGGEIYLEWLSIKCVRDDKGKIQHYVGVFSDITEKKQSEEIIWRQANFDTLTQLPNRRMFRDRLDTEIKKAHRSNQKMALLFIDLDHFKEVNDTLGHEKGDILLIEAAQRINHCVREVDTVGRLGGDEFTVLLTDLGDMASIERAALEIVRRLAEPFSLGDEPAYVSASIGVALFPNDATNIEDLFKCADQAMYLAKNEGRNQYKFYSSKL